MTNTLLSACLIAVTEPLPETGLSGADELIAYCARVSSSNQTNPEYLKLLRYCIENRHWSVFTMANAVIEIIGPRDITRQFTRHESMAVIEHDHGFELRPDGFDKHAGGVQEFSQRYSDAIGFTPREVRRQDQKNRQNSTDDLGATTKSVCEDIVAGAMRHADEAYQALRARDVAKECARVVLPEGMTMSRLYVNGTLRSWLHYLDTRRGNGTQLEHVELAYEIEKAVMRAFPVVAELRHG